MSENSAINISEYRQPEHPINPLILGRWSPRALSGEPLTAEELMSLFEAAKWAPSSSNQQPWRFIYARRDTPAWSKLFSLLTPSNQEWTQRAAALIVIVSQQVFPAGPSRTASFVTGAAWENLALEASGRGLVAHAMSGFDYDRAKIELKVPDDYKVEAMAAVGRPGDKEQLPERHRKWEFPSGRKSLHEIISEGEFRF